MTLAASIPKEIYDGNGVATNFSFPHYFFANSELVVKHKDADDVQTTLVLDTDYTVNGVGTATGSIDFPKVGSAYDTLAAGVSPEQLMTKRVQVKERTPDLTGSYQFSTVNTGGDKQTAMIQELLEMLSRASLLDDFSTTTIPTLDAIIAAMFGQGTDTTAVHVDTAAEISAITEKTTILDADKLILESDANSDAKRMVTVANLLAAAPKEIILAKYDSATSWAVEDGVVGITIGATYNGWKIKGAIAATETKGIQTGSETMDIQIRRKRAGAAVDVLTTEIEVGDEFFATSTDVNTSNNTVQTGDLVFVDINAIHLDTAALGGGVSILLKQT